MWHQNLQHQNWKSACQGVEIAFANLSCGFESEEVAQPGDELLPETLLFRFSIVLCQRPVIGAAAEPVERSFLLFNGTFHRKLFDGVAGRQRIGIGCRVLFLVRPVGGSSGSMSLGWPLSNPRHRGNSLRRGGLVGGSRRSRLSMIAVDGSCGGA